ncbi:hypothetical protein [Nocardia brasiliensis]|uniref:hypothetical protein n=1 Tax=Nocardia brasiliensis TaxID=37326 RepID=UPI002454D5B9|nr:hypothetical protein [Nocardia brasiliensis]
MVNDDEDIRGFLQHANGSWAAVGYDGWPIEADDLEPAERDALEAVAWVIIDVEPVSVVDTEPLDDGTEIGHGQSPTHVGEHGLSAGERAAAGLGDQ